MAWTQSGNRFKHSRRVGDRVVTTYVHGPEARVAAAEIASRKERLNEARKQLQELRQEDAALMRLSDLARESTLALSQAELLLLGYHCHRSQWRKYHG